MRKLISRDQITILYVLKNLQFCEVMLKVRCDGTDHGLGFSDTKYIQL